MGNFNYPSVVPTGVMQWQKANGVVVLNSLTQSKTPLAKATIKSGASVPGYIDKLRKGLDATSSYIRQGYNIVPGSYTMRSEQRWGGQNIDSFRREQFATALPDPSYIASQVTTEAGSILRRKLRQNTGQSNQLTNVAELRDLPKTIRSVAGSATKLVSTVLNSNRRGRDLKAFASDQWLTWSFGVLPTLAAVDDAVSSVNSYLSRKDHMLRDFGVFEKDWVSSTKNTLSGSHHCQIEYNGSFHHSLSCKITAGHRFNLRSAESYSLPKHLGFDITSVVPTLWELLPYSWLVDYFTTAGRFIEDQFDADFGTSSIYISQAVKYRIQGQVEAKPIRLFTLSPITYWSSVPLKFEYFEFVRTPLTSLPRAPLRFKTKEEIAHNAVNKLLNLTALLGSRN